MKANTEILPPKPTEERSLEWCFQQVADQLKKRGQSVQRTIMAHVRAKTGKNIPLPLLHRDPSFTDDFKKELYKECVAAMVTGNYTKLQGDIGQGDKQVIEQLPTDKPQKPAVNVLVEQALAASGWGPPDKEGNVYPAGTKRATQPTTTAAESPKMIPTTGSADATLPEPVVAVKPQPLPTLSPMTALIFTELQPHIERLVDDRVAHGMSNGAFPVERVQELIDKRVRLAGTITPEIVAALQSLLSAIQNSLTAPNTSVVGVIRPDK